MMKNSSQYTLLVDDKNVERFGMKLIDYELQPYIKRKTTGIDIPGAHGAQAVPSSLSSNSLVAKIVCSGNSSNDVQSSIRQFFAYMYSTQEAHKLVFTDDPSVVRYAILDSPDSYKVVRGIDSSMAELKLNFLMLDPFTYTSEAERMIAVAQSEIPIIVENDAFECSAVFKIQNNGNSNVSNISISVNGETANFSCSLKSGDVITLDTVEYEVQYNGDNLLEIWTGEMPKLKNGENVIVLRNDETADLLLCVEFTKQWV